MPDIKVLLPEIGAEGDLMLVPQKIMILVLLVSKGKKKKLVSSPFFLATVCNLPTQSTQSLHSLNYTVVIFLTFTSSFSH